MLRFSAAVLAIIVLLTIPGFACDNSDDENKISYKVTFKATWSSTSHPTDFPDNPHFSGLIGATHSSSITLWEEGEQASPGIQNMAEKGSKDPLSDEIDALIDSGSAFSCLSGDGVGVSPGEVSLDFTIHEDYPLVSLVTMIAPSPDWFVGVSALNLYEDGKWVESKIVDLHPYDAGTDSGVTFTSADNATDPHVNIFEIETDPFLKNSEVQSMGTFTFTLKS